MSSTNEAKTDQKSGTIISLREHEYDDDLYSGVPESAIERQLGEKITTAGIEWLVRVGDLDRASDESLVLAT
ncbi:hypothetical protein JCM18237_16520 [Halorubrum luteum]